MTLADWQLLKLEPTLLLTPFRQTPLADLADAGPHTLEMLTDFKQV